jgi:hypothetical protein
MFQGKAVIMKVKKLITASGEQYFENEDSYPVSVRQTKRPPLNLQKDLV